MKHFSKILFPSLLLTALVGCGPKWTETESNGIKTVTNEGGKTLGYSTTSGVTIITLSTDLGLKT
ncbi:MAG: hypothetical protein U5K54_23795 [Cytophagales bacterium]|nr:hypothetical protein [Cytophagales bacterium]